MEKITLKIAFALVPVLIFCVLFFLLVSGQMVACEVEELADGMKVCILFVLFKQVFGN